jgi:hypothetical protein
MKDTNRVYDGYSEFTNYRTIEYVDLGQLKTKVIARLQTTKVWSEHWWREYSDVRQQMTFHAPLMQSTEGCLKDLHDMITIMLQHHWGLKTAGDVHLLVCKVQGEIDKILTYAQRTFRYFETIEAQRKTKSLSSFGKP